MVFSFWRLMESTVTKKKMGARTSTAPMITQGGTESIGFFLWV
jgi:hypothetical protein